MLRVTVLGQQWAGTDPTTLERSRGGLFWGFWKAASRSVRVSSLCQALVLHRVYRPHDPNPPFPQELITMVFSDENKSDRTRKKQLVLLLLYLLNSLISV